MQCMFLKAFATQPDRSAVQLKVQLITGLGGRAAAGLRGKQADKSSVSGTGKTGIKFSVGFKLSLASDQDDS